MNYNLEIENNIAEVAKIEKFIQLASSENNFNDKTIYELNLILEEIITNIIKYGYDETDKSSHKINIQLKVENDCVEMYIIDDSNEFDITKNKKDWSSISKKITDLIPGGLGIHLIFSYSDDILYERKGRMNILKIIKYLNKNNPSWKSTKKL
jgi:anti-sigma regulatory factor (Ser/Thr protein kinase)